MNAKILSNVLGLSDQELLEQLKSLAHREHEATVALIAHLAELDRRRLYLQEGYSSMFVYCTLVLHLSEHAAYARIQAARLIGRFPVILEMLEDGALNLTTIVLLAPHLTQENHSEVLREARYKNKAEIEKLRARLHPQPDIPSSIRRLPSHLLTVLSPHDERGAYRKSSDEGHLTESPAASSIPLMPQQPRPAVIVPLAPERYKVQFTASAETYEKLQLAQKLLRREIPTGNPAEIFDRALTALLQDLAKKKLAATDRPRARQWAASNPRHVPAGVKREVWLRDGGRCVFVGRDGRRCSEEMFLEYHHVTPHAAGGASTVGNIQLRCRAHNVYEAELDFPGVHYRGKNGTG